jgi:protein-tyrosine phosphatase
LKDKTRICFVCSGNIIRSPLAEHFFLHHLKEAGIEHKYEVGSGGTGSWHIGEAPDPRMRRVAARYGLVYNGRARQLKRLDFDRYDLIIAMDSENKESLGILSRNEDDRKKIRLLREFDPHGGPDAPVPDPYYGRSEGFDEVYHIVERSTRGLLNALEKGELDEVLENGDLE